MADRYATKDGDWSDVSVWDGGVSLPGAGDTVRPNGFDVVIDQSITVGILTNNASGAAVANGTFTLVDGITVNADIEGRAAPNADFVICSAGDQFVVGNVTAFVGSGWVLRKTTSGLLSITGDLTCAASGTSHAVYLQNNASLSVVGDLGNDGGEVNGNSSSVFTTSSGDISVTGDVIGARARIFSVRPGLYSTGTGNITVTGTVRGGAQGVYSYGVYCTQAVTVVHNGDAIADALPAIALTSTSSIYVHNGNAQSASNGKQALDVRGYYLISSALSTTHAYRTNNSGVAGDERTLYTLNALPVAYAPAESDVRNGAVYNNGESTGSLVVPTAESVAYGVPVDNTTGLALLTAEAITSVVGPPSVVQVSPISSRIASRVTSSNLHYFVGEVISWNIAVVDSNGNVNMEEHNGSLELNFARFDETTVATVTTFEISSNVVTFTNPASITVQSWKLNWALRHSTTKEVFAYGVASVEFAA